MPLDEDTAKALTFLALRIRRDTYGAGPWDDRGTFVNIMKLEGRNLAITADAVIRHASDVNAKTPGVIGSDWTPPRLPLERPEKRGNPKHGEDCPIHAGQWPDNCGGCKTDALVGTPVPTAQKAAGDTTAGAKAARAALRGES